MNDSSRSITEHRTGVRVGLLALAAPIVLVGGWALIAPHGWYDTFPGGGRHWVSALGPYDEHLVRDFGGTYLGLGLLLGAAAVLLDRLVAQVALASSLVFQVPHFIFHAGETGSLSTGDNVVNLVLLAAGLGLTVALLVAIRAPRPGAARQPQPIEGGVSYGTR
jgi:hypothetical protein